jgi:hypothetical protein
MESKLYRLDGEIVSTLPKNGIAFDRGELEELLGGTINFFPLTADQVKRCGGSAFPVDSVAVCREGGHVKYIHYGPIGGHPAERERIEADHGLLLNIFSLRARDEFWGPVLLCPKSLLDDECLGNNCRVQ